MATYYGPRAPEVLTCLTCIYDIVLYFFSYMYCNNITFPPILFGRGTRDRTLRTAWEATWTSGGVHLAHKSVVSHLCMGLVNIFFFFKEKRTGRRRARSKVQEWIEVVRKNELFEKYYKVSTVLISER